MAPPYNRPEPRPHFSNPGQSQRSFLAQRAGTQYSPISAPIPSQEEIHKTFESLKSQVHNFPSYVATTLKPCLQSKVDKFRAGQLSEFYSEWQQLTSDASNV